MKRSVVLILALLLLAPAAGYFMLPRADEHISMLIRDGKYREAAAELRQLQARGDKDPGLLVPLARTREAAGDVSGALGLMKTYVAQRPVDPTGFDYLARLNVLANLPDEAIKAMTQQVAIEPNPQNVARLAGWYRLYGRFDDEFDLLNRMRQRKILLTPPDLVRLGEYRAAKGDRLGAIAPLLDADAQLPPDEDRGRVVLFDILVAEGRYHEAVSRALVWLGTWKKPWIATRLLESLPRQTPEHDAASLAAAVLKLRPETAFYVAKLLADHGQFSVAAVILSHWAQEVEKPTVNEIGGLVGVVRATGDRTLLWRLLPDILKKTDSLEAQGYFVEALAFEFGDDAIASLTAAVPQAVFEARPLFAARLALRVGQRPLALRYLMQVRLAEAPPRDQRAWLALFEDATSQEIALKLLLDWRGKGEIPRDLLPQLAELAGRLGYSSEQMMILQELARL